MTFIRLAEVDDALVLADLHIRSWQSAYRHILPPEFLDSLDVAQRTEFWQRLLDGGTEVLVADDDQVIGFCHAGESNDEGWGEIYSIYVDPDHWGRGVGGGLLAAGQERLVGLGFEDALLWVLEDNESARRFYESRGWVPGKRFHVLEIGGTPVTEVRYEIGLGRVPAPSRGRPGR